MGNDGQSLFDPRDDDSEDAETISVSPAQDDGQRFVSDDWRWASALVALGAVAQYRTKKQRRNRPTQKVRFIDNDRLDN